MAGAESPLHASPGDRLVIRGPHVGQTTRDAEIIDVLGEHGRPPYVVRWEDDGHVTRLYPGSDAYVQHFEHGKAAPEPGDAALRTGEPGEGVFPSPADWEAAAPPSDS